MKKIYQILLVLVLIFAILYLVMFSFYIIKGKLIKRKCLKRVELFLDNIKANKIEKALLIWNDDRMDIDDFKRMLISNGLDKINQYEIINSEVVLYMNWCIVYVRIPNRKHQIAFLVTDDMIRFSAHSKYY